MTLTQPSRFSDILLPHRSPHAVHSPATFCILSSSWRPSVTCSLAPLLIPRNPSPPKVLCENSAVMPTELTIRKIRLRPKNELMAQILQSLTDLKRMFVNQMGGVKQSKESTSLLEAVAGLGVGWGGQPWKPRIKWSTKETVSCTIHARSSCRAPSWRPISRTVLSSRTPPRVTWEHTQAERHDLLWRWSYDPAPVVFSASPFASPHGNQAPHCSPTELATRLLLSLKLSLPPSSCALMVWQSHPSTLC